MLSSTRLTPVTAARHHIPRRCVDNHTKWMFLKLITFRAGKLSYSHMCGRILLNQLVLFVIILKEWHIVTVPHVIQRIDYTELRICASSGRAYGNIGEFLLCNTCTCR